MAESNSTEHRAGASAIMAVAGQLEHMLAGDSRQSCGEYFSQYDQAVAALMAVAGPLPDRAAGALQALAEIIVGGIQNCGDYDLTTFEPDATMTAEQIAARRQELFDMEAAGLRQDKPGNVIQLRC